MSHHVQLPAEHGKRLAVDTVSVACCVDIWASLVDLRVDGKRGSVDGFVAFDDLTIFVDENQVRDGD